MKYKITLEYTEEEFKRLCKRICVHSLMLENTIECDSPCTNCWEERLGKMLEVIKDEQV